MDIATLLGLVIGMAVVTFAILSGSDLVVFLNLPGFLIVVCGTFAATLIKFPISTVFVAFKLGVKAAFGKDRDDPGRILDQVIGLAERARKGGMLAMQDAEITNDFLKRGIQLCVDGHDLPLIRKALTDEMELTIKRHDEGAKIFRGIGDSAPAFGMIGTLVGLVQMLANMDDPKAIGPAMAVALLTTLYGALIANLIALPIADKLETKLEQARVNMTLVIEGVAQIHNKQNPSVLVELLGVYLPEKQRAKRNGEEQEASLSPAPAAASTGKAA